MTKIELFKLISEHTVDDIAIAPESSLETDLQMDELDLIILCMEVEEQANIEVSDDDLIAWKTVSDIMKSAGVTDEA